MKDSYRLPGLPEQVKAARSPRWDYDRLQHRSCVVCNADKAALLVIRPDLLSVHRCIICGFIYLADVPSSDEVSGFYTTYGAFKGRRGGRRFMAKLKCRLEAQGDRHIRILEESGGIAGQSICEIGCSFGGFLEKARTRRGLVTGIELDYEARSYVTGLGITCLISLDLTKKYDVVCLFQVLEHLFDPASMVSDIAKVLRPDGRLLISLPNAGQVRDIGSTWVGFRADLEHINYFNIKSLASLLSDYGLFIEKYWIYQQASVQRCSADCDGPKDLSYYITNIWKFIGNILRKEDLFPSGSYVLTVLARRINSLQE